MTTQDDDRDDLELFLHVDINKLRAFIAETMAILRAEELQTSLDAVPDGGPAAGSAPASAPSSPPLTDAGPPLPPG